MLRHSVDVDLEPRTQNSSFVMRQRDFLCFLWTALILRGDILVAAEADPAILNGADLSHLQQVSNRKQSILYLYFVVEFVYENAFNIIACDLDTNGSIIVFVFHDMFVL